MRLTLPGGSLSGTTVKSSQGLVLRAVLACPEGGSNRAVAAWLDVNRGTVTKWRARFLEEVIVRTLEETPAGATHWSKREARRTGISPARGLTCPTPYSASSKPEQ